MLVGAGHAAWGLLAYRRPLLEIARAGGRRTVGDGLLDRAHADGARAAAFWFMHSAPLIAIVGGLVDAAWRRGTTGR